MNKKRTEKGVGDDKSAIEKQSTSNSKSKMISIILRYLVAIVLIVFAGWSFYNYQQTKKEVVRLSTIEGQREVQQQEVIDLLDQVKKHMLLPEDEEPTVATVTNIDELKSQQPFFEQANNGDKVIIYVNSHKAIIYSPEKDMIINVGTLIVDNPNTEQADQNQQAQQSEGNNETTGSDENQEENSEAQEGNDVEESEE